MTVPHRDRNGAPTRVFPDSGPQHGPRIEVEEVSNTRAAVRCSPLDRFPVNPAVVAFLCPFRAHKRLSPSLRPLHLSPSLPVNRVLLYASPACSQCQGMTPPTVQVPERTAPVHGLLVAHQSPAESLSPDSPTASYNHEPAYIGNLNEAMSQPSPSTLLPSPRHLTNRQRAT